ncbi:MAG TPA: hypothetical protein DCY79_19000 [Planctomycetaceae bacterium]|jgi:hypothetical protein|nr:hypothetical protein [Blastopirellula sp.]HAY81896.1 hypothetical protein [Planctomycetaceae bacterium]
MKRPQVTIRLSDQGQPFAAGQVLECEYQMRSSRGYDVLAIEESVLWYTEGKGDEDLMVHHFHRRVDGEDGQDLYSPHLLHTQLPRSPLSYAGVIVKIHWCVRIRVFVKQGKEFLYEEPFQLGDVPPGTCIDDAVEGGDLK